MPDGLAVLDTGNQILWANKLLARWIESLSGMTDLAGQQFYTAMGEPEIMGPDFCPFHTALATSRTSSSTLATKDNRYFEVHVAPLEGTEIGGRLVASVADVTQEVTQQQKLEAIYRAGRELADLRADEICLMNVDERVELLKENIRHCLSDLLNFEVIEIRLLEQASGKLIPLLSVGLEENAAHRELSARLKNNGVTGYVASTGKTYLCVDTSQDPLYLQGAADAKSSLTVPLMLHDQVLGTLNVESPEPRAFSQSDIQFLETFARDVAYALNTLELLVAQQANATQQSCDAIHSAVALPIDAILNDAVNVLETYIGHNAELVDRMRKILQNARDIKQVIQQIGNRMSPTDAVPAGLHRPKHALLEGRRILVVDADQQVRNNAHELLERYGCIVETAHEGSEAVGMVRSTGGQLAYDAVISDIRLPDFSGYQLMCRLSQQMEHVPMILMTGFGYDPGHSIVKARQAGLHPKAVLFKPFRLDQLIDVLETVITIGLEHRQHQTV